MITPVASKWLGQIISSLPAQVHIIAGGEKETLDELAQRVAQFLMVNSETDSVIFVAPALGNVPPRMKLLQDLCKQYWIRFPTATEVYLKRPDGVIPPEIVASYITPVDAQEFPAVIDRYIKARAALRAKGTPKPPRVLAPGQEEPKKPLPSPSGILASGRREPKKLLSFPFKSRRETPVPPPVSSETGPETPRPSEQEIQAVVPPPSPQGVPGEEAVVPPPPPQEVPGEEAVVPPPSPQEVPEGDAAAMVKQQQREEVAVVPQGTGPYGWSQPVILVGFPPEQWVTDVIASVQRKHRLRVVQITWVQYNPQKGQRAVFFVDVSTITSLQQVLQQVSLHQPAVLLSTRKIPRALLPLSGKIRLYSGGWRDLEKAILEVTG